MSTLPSSPECTAYPPPSSFTAAARRESELELIGTSAAMSRLRLQVDRIGPHFRTVLIRGEAGTEGELVAQRLHRLSHGASRAFVRCHAGALEDALPGRTRATTSANALEKLTRMAEGGTLFLDGIDELHIDAQATLLRILRNEFADGERKLTQRLASRIIASTSHDLRMLASASRFGQELYQRLAAVEIAIPPLRDRTEDIPPLVDRILVGLAESLGCPVCILSPEAMNRLLGYAWPGNTRELENLLRTAMLQHEGSTIEAHHLPSFAEIKTEAPDRQDTQVSLRLQHVIERHVMRVLIDCGGNKLRAAERLGISRSTLYRMLDTGGTDQTTDQTANRIGGTLNLDSQ